MSKVDEEIMRAKARCSDEGVRRRISKSIDTINQVMKGLINE